MASTWAPIGRGSVPYRALLAGLLAVAAAALWAAHHMDSEGHHITGMDNQVVWGLPHVFAVFLIVAASGALNAASLASVFSRQAYKPLARLSVVLACALLIGGLAVLVLDLGRPERLIVALTHYNFRSVFAWNIFLYTGLLAVALVYLWLMMDPPLQRHSRLAGFAAFGWRLVLTTGTGSIFGFLVARQAYDAALMAPLFVALSLALGSAAFALVLLSAGAACARAVEPALVQRLARTLAVFVLATAYFVAVQYLTMGYATEHHGVLRFLLFDTGHPFAAAFWLGQVLAGLVVPLALLWWPPLAGSRAALAIAAALVVAGGFVQLYVIIIGGQAYPLVLFPGAEVTSSFFDGVATRYAASAWEVLLGLGGVALALLILCVAVRVLPIVPASFTGDADKA